MIFNLITNPVGVSTLAKREIVRFLAVSSQTIFPSLISSGLFLYIFGIALGTRMTFTIPGMTYLEYLIPGLMSMHMISSSYENTSSSLFIGRWHNNIQEVLLSPLSYFEMVLGLLAGGITRGALIGLGIFALSRIFTPLTLHHPFWLLYFTVMIGTIFSCAGMLAALWAEDFRTLNLWNVYLIIPLVLTGGVFHPLSLLPDKLKNLAHLNPIHYLINGIRYSVTGFTEQNIWICAALALLLAAIFGFVTVSLFRAGYKLRT